MRYLGLDYGTKRIGVAIADDAVEVAIPRGVLDGGEKVIVEIASLCKKEQIEKIVVGLPRTLKGEEGEMAQKVRAFGQKLEDHLHIPIAFVDERLSSREVSQEGVQSVDAAAATVILQTWLDRRHAQRDSKNRQKNENGV